MARSAIGSLNQRILIQRLPTQDDGGGGQVGSGAAVWKDVCRTWARVEPMAGERERLAQLHLSSTVPYRVVTRYRTGLTPRLRIQWRDKTLAVSSITDTDIATAAGRQRRLLFECLEVQA